MAANQARIDGLAALGDPTRRAIFAALAERPQAVGELARELPVSRPAVSQHLKILKRARLVLDRPAGTRRIYRLDPQGIGALRAELEQFWTKTLAAYKEVVENRTEEVPHEHPGSSDVDPDPGRRQGPHR